MTPSDGATATPTVTLNDDHTIPVIGLGVGELSETEAEQAVLAALEAGYRLIDTAAAYGNEEAVGRAVKASGVPREEVFITTKLAASDLGFQSSQDALKASLQRLGLDYVDLYLIHWPAGEHGKFVDSWGGLMKRKEDGETKSIGVANFHAEHLADIIDLSFFTPAVNQIELHPLLNQAELREVNAGYGILTQAYSPLGVGRLLDNATVSSVAKEQGKTPAQVLLRWNLQLGNAVVARSTSPERMKSNIEVFDFELTDDQMAALNALDDGTRFRPNPDTYAGE
ncbi:aldo/keto reductase [Mycolicibacterium holsaticum]|jgi:diketogulonate reductase-like aldo/keto reductase|uniref:2,5-didehydrogluconate reductase A n=1 Tax=Mycolicibacterium holsaticum TaxID=152142 RepID=A0A1E3RQN2_9MYCO|nr:aldo/keto reductase [Mycolicibacterium holsaticum]MDA4110460.1 2,5-diketo-D-gluconic acid reductase [Mycolicibacterium holsaticum DSM 44478 = JCM 12374]ODQ92158.1 2,5-didehydrogluconate reductase A [Mycolicibacterium holsaticum]QZA10968.1 aldo/keto reductase [Mycolicibacterium holsaticum DSM 44478 = JCM 12374]UNC11536.1 aldo/keto reductase [Mycolicibacterium holsaticum DSM 44478 = JCM 12374]